MSNGVKSFSVTEPKAKGNAQAIIISYGTTNVVDPAYSYLDNTPDTNNKVNLRFPLNGNVEFEDEYEPQGIEDVSLFCTIGGVNYQYGGKNFADCFHVDSATRKVTFQFGEDWVTQVIASKLVNAEGTMVLKFTVRGMHDDGSSDVEFTATFSINTASQNRFDLPPLNITSQYNEVSLSSHLNTPLPAKNQETVNINYGAPKTPGTPDYSYEGNTPDSKNEVELMLPLDFSVDFDNTVYPHGEFTGIVTSGTGAPKVSVNIPGINKDNRIDYNLGPSEINKFFSIGNNGGSLHFNLNPDWNIRVNAALLNKAGSCAITCSFTAQFRVTEIDGSFTSHNLAISARPAAGAVPTETEITVYPVKFNSQEYQPVPAYSVTFTIDQPKSKSGNNPYNIVYGDANAPSAGADYKKSDDETNEYGNVSIYLPLSGSLEFDKDTIIGDVSKIETNLQLTLSDKTTVIKHEKNLTFVKGGDHKLTFNADDAWGISHWVFDLTAGPASLLCEFTLPLKINGKETSKEFLIRTGSNNMYISHNENVNVPNFQFYAKEPENTVDRIQLHNSGAFYVKLQITYKGSDNVEHRSSKETDKMSAGNESSLTPKECKIPEGCQVKAFANYVGAKGDQSNVWFLYKEGCKMKACYESHGVITGAYTDCNGRRAYT